MNGKKQHLDFIDLAKGMCILFVVSYHVDNCQVLYANQHVNDLFMSFRIPFYFMLSGLFVSFNSGYLNFIVKKINRLVIPFAFFFVLTYLYSFVFTFLRQRLMGEADGDIFNCSPYNFLILENVNLDYPNIPIWFLVSLFTTYVFYLALDALCRHRDMIMLVMSFVLGVCGYICCVRNVQIPFYLDSSMTCMPFVAFGNILRKKADILQFSDRKKTLLVIVVCVVLLILSYGGNSTFYCNSYEANIANLYLAGCSGSLAMLLISKLIGRCPVVNYIGRYSIIVLGTHSFFIGIYTPIISRVMPDSVILSKALLFLTVVVSCMICIYIMRRFIPWLVAQKDVISIETKNR